MLLFQLPLPLLVLVVFKYFDTLLVIVSLHTHTLSFPLLLKFVSLVKIFERRVFFLSFFLYQFFVDRKRLDRGFIKKDRTKKNMKLFPLELNIVARIWFLNLSVNCCYVWTILLCATPIKICMTAYTGLK